MQHNTVTEIGGAFRRKYFAENCFDFFRFFQAVNQTETIGKTNAVRIYNNRAGHPVEVAEQQVCSLPSDTRKLQQFFHGVRNSAAVVPKQDGGTINDIPRLCTEKTTGVDHFLHFSYVGLSE